ncbi:MAG: hypothetical protein P5702_20670 [Limnospira sp. PMC 1291.21]|uniref:Uncharacterized protein n=1 Tax=Limnospira fusiformis PMC 851.14 TaxID=2219512 RepID=A0ABU9ET95_LIMFS|nr:MULTISPECIES: hypothetical protein [Limnospira]MDY7051356.1 hypothetical protein [Limnospira fusiformis LS22]MDT9180074.1 hypothetical protein [Limnospira sp. PMC 1238.20]MDT9190020.1 hypothetical protein [Limnospira sp. PMC 894.15]MDT9195341.1 hypothetical protein [Limnospira sp. PMC 1245.20]MDT9200363.1 hypothetical protein [Limnospira sp. PMC 1042.18]
MIYTRPFPAAVLNRWCDRIPDGFGKKSANRLNPPISPRARLF